MKTVSRFFTLSSSALALVAMILLLLTGCNERGPAHRLAGKSSYPMESDRFTKREEPAPAAAAMEMSASHNSDSTLAYTHDVQIEITREHLIAQIEAVKQACNVDKQAACTILSTSNSNDDQIPSGAISMRLMPSKVENMVGLAGEHGKITSRSTVAEDLAPQLNDSAQKLTTLNIYRERLNGLMAKRDLPADQLIAVAKELSTTQSQIDELSHMHAELKHRVDTDLLNLQFSVPPEERQLRYSPVMDSIRSFGEHLRSAISGVIDFFAYALPWIPVIFVLLFGVRKLWQFFKKKPLTQPST